MNSCPFDANIMAAYFDGKCPVEHKERVQRWLYANPDYEKEMLDTLIRIQKGDLEKVPVGISEKAEWVFTQA
jgi:hypothetical protein